MTREDLLYRLTKIFDGLDVVFIEPQLGGPATAVDDPVAVAETFLDAIEHDGLQIVVAR